ncbi:MAG: xanthine dehydrogenase family protein subunit M, partial [Pseudomonadota bacterium]|nr:xanthine dehydrogenase family protein subunit M [Pseudomonadota bacterium]MEE3238155.1 xanthine dehydrogenase family protein subunit M [Pseudomonadota bacterium]
MYDFSYLKVSSVTDAVTAIQKAEDGKFVAGGQTMLPTMKHRLASPSDLIDLGGITELNGIDVDGGTVTIGAMTTHATVAASTEVQNAIPALAKLAGNIGDPAVRNRGTIGGSIANNDPAADYPAAVIALGAVVKTSKREIPGDEFFTGMFETALEEDEIITAVTFPKPDVAAYMKFENPASRYAIVG